ncbi:SRPBCC domain-containing protein [Roseimicrobium sp. ORNL1]|uniref:SRPBCC domain-containing protein n=1 Tax=Roseimicrobium sp. ORNL1 TaxID=2711231 RepID=UPI00197DFB02|nr:SRPBCC domain-containing protein [Roseimicrobium sp. ORNL1]
MKQDSAYPFVRVVRRISFPAERVFDAWLNPRLASQWLFATPTGKMVRAEADARVGGKFTYTERRDGEDVEHTGEYLEIDRPRRLVFTFGVPKYSKDFTKVTVEIEPQGESCVLTLTQDVHPDWVHFAPRSQDGWTTIVEGLAASLGDRYAVVNREPVQVIGKDEARVVRLLPGPVERVWAYLMESDKRKTWFTDGTIEPRLGGDVHLHFRHANISPNETPPEKYRTVHDPGVPMAGKVVAYEPPHRLGITWEGEKPGENSEVIFDLEPKGEDVQLTLTHRKLCSDAERADVSSGWHLHTAVLFARLSGDTPSPLWAAHDRLEAFYKKRMNAASADATTAS